MKSPKLKIVHIFTDIKFISSYKRFENENIVNKVFYIKNSQELELAPITTNTTVLLEDQLEELLRNCNESDLVVLYNLDDFKTRLCLEINNNIKIAWRFFGTEIYTKNESLYYSALTLKAKKPTIVEKLKMLGLLNGVKKLIPYRKKNSSKKKINDVDFFKAIQKIDFFLGLFEEEYDYLKNSFELPEFIQLDFSRKREIVSKEISSNKSNNIIIGNSASAFNNHLDIINIFLRSRNFRMNNYTIPFSYPSKNFFYKFKVRKVVEEFTEIKLLEEFMNPDEYYQLFKQSKAFISNSYRQHAVGNILNALSQGLKVYLNKKNIIYHWLINHGFLIFSIDVLYEDTEKENLELSAIEQNINIEKLSSLYESYDNMKFLETIIKKTLG